MGSSLIPTYGIVNKIHCPFFEEDRLRNILLLSFLTVVFSFGLNQVANALCVQNGNTPSGGNIINCPAPIQNTPLDDVSVPNTTPPGR